MNRIPYDETLIQSCERSLRAAFSQPALRLGRRPVRRMGDFAVEIDSSQLFARTDEDSGPQPVAEILTESVCPGSFYFSFKAAFVLWSPESSHGRTHILDHASVTVFQALTAGELGACFRADWDPRAVLDTESQHAQPHWHFVQRPARIEGIVRTLISSPGEFTSEIEPELFASLPAIDRFHFAMSPLWDQNNGVSHKTDFEAGSFDRWFGKLVQYIAAQLVYICGKSGGGVQGPVEFEPDADSINTAI